jgi:ABC-type branched-subunit amino acid transport system substrate-binding protein
MFFHLFGLLTILAIGPCSAQPQSTSSNISEDELLEQIQEAKTDKEKTFSMLHLAEKYRLEARYNEAKSLYAAAGKSKAAQQFSDSIHVGTALIYTTQSNAEEAYRTLEENMENKNILATQKGSLYAELSKQAFTKGDIESADYYASQARKLANSQNQQSIEDVLAQIESKEVPLEKSDIESSSLDALRTAMQEGSLEEAQNIISALQNENLDEDSLAYIDATQKRVDAGDPFFADKLGILLPTTHEKYTPVATAFQQSIEYSNAQLTMPFQLVFYDTKGDPLEAKKGVEELVLKEGCAVIIGPLLKSTVMEAAEMATLYEVPMLTLSKENTPLEKGEFIFYVGLSPERQFSGLIEHAIIEKNVTRFAALAPDTESSKALISAFEEEVLRMNGTFVRSQFYPPETTDFRETARIFSDKTDPSIRADKIDEVPPRTDFDVLFIPDNFRNTPLITSALAYEGFKMGSFDAGHDIPKTHLIGLNSWNNPNIIRSSGQYMIGSLFMDAIWMNSEDEQYVLFKDSFTESLKRKPNIFDAILHDTLQFAALAHKSASRYEIKSNIQTQSILKALTGGLRFLEDRELDRSLIMLELKKHGIEPWKAPEE